MKRNSVVNTIPPVYLYIPHGSDETNVPYNRIQVKLKDFISHTVQMKHWSLVSIIDLYLNFISHTVQMKHFSNFAKKCFLLVFISHTVQMKLEITTSKII